MRLRLISSTPLDIIYCASEDRFLAARRERTGTTPLDSNQTRKPDGVTEIGSGLCLTRRELIIRSAAIAMFSGSAAGCGPDDHDLGDLIAATISLLAMAAVTFLVDQALGGRIELTNGRGAPVRGTVGFALRNEGGDEVASAGGEYQVDAYTVNEYEWVGLRAQQRGVYNVAAESRLSRAATPVFHVN